MSEIEVGEWVRLKDGRIRVFKQYINDTDVELTRPYNLEKKADIVKHSKNIIDLIEIDDIVILEYYVAKYKRRIIRKFTVFKAGSLIRFDNQHCDFLYDITNQKWCEENEFNIKIKEILTKEQFSANSYKVGE